MALASGIDTPLDPETLGGLRLTVQKDAVVLDGAGPKPIALVMPTRISPD